MFPETGIGDSNEFPPSTWVLGPDVSNGQIYDIQYNYGGNLEDGCNEQHTDTFHYWVDAIENGAAVRYGEPVTTTTVFPNTNGGDNAESNQQSDTTVGNGSQTTAFAGGATQPGNDSVADGGSTVLVPPIVNSPTRPNMTGFPAWYFRSRTRSQILEGIPIITRHQIPNSLPPGMASFGQGGNSCWSGQIPPGTAIGPFGMAPCVGLMLRPLNANGVFHSYHFGEADDIRKTLIQTGALGYEVFSESANVLQPTEPFIAYLAGGSDLNKLQQTIDILKSHGIKIGGYLPCATFQIDANGQLYWTHPTGNSTAEFE